MSGTDSCSAGTGPENVSAVGNPSVSKYVPPHKFAGKSGEENTIKTSVRREKIIRVCHFYESGRSCRFGENCRYLHQKQTRSVSDTDEDQMIYQEREGDEEHEENEEGMVKGEHGENDKKNKIKRTEKICRYFSRNNRCFYGDKCKFKHIFEKEPKKQKDNDPNSTVPSDVPLRRPVNPEEFPVVSTPDGRMELDFPTSHQDNSDSGKLTERNFLQPKPCRYFLAGRCSRGQNCRFSHQSDLMVDNKQTAPKRQQPYQRPLPGRSNASMVLDKLTRTELSNLRKTEIEQLQKRYPKAETLQHNTEDEIEGHRLTFQPTDPDWPYDVKEVLMDVYFPNDYPKVAMKINIGEDERIPEVVRRHIELAVGKWVQQRHESQLKNGHVELAFRQLLRWLDRKLEDVFTEGLTQYKRELVARAAGIEFIPASELQQKYQSNSAPVEGDQEDEEGDLSGDDINDNKENEINQLNQEESEQKTEEDDRSAGGNFSALDPVKKGTEVKLANLQLRESAATLQGIKIHLLVQCTRCKHQTDVVTPGNRVNQAHCGRCGHTMLVTYRPALVHQFASVLGYLDLEGCLPFDLVLSESQFHIGCLACSKEMKMMGLPPGQPKDTWCQHCHEKMRFAVECVRFQQLQPAQQIDTSNIHMVAVQKVRKVAKDPAIQEGKPLPANGTCKHYKKSYRWLRFPCCGKTYPCDLCHDEKEMDHDMKYANRMICGFCCKEQPYAAERPCVACDSNMTKKAGTHWEGGQGCRDKIKMAKGDAQKYAGTKKTISRKAQAALPEKKAK